MSTLAWVLVLVGFIVIRQSAKGRALNIPQDLSDVFQAAIRGDTDAVGEVFARSGDSLTASETDLAKWDAVGNEALASATTGVAFGTAVASGVNSGLAARTVLLGSQAKGYRWTATGPDYYDCSGLIWRACKDLGIYTGPRFTTATIGLLSAFAKVSSPQVNDIVCWTGHHMGVVTGPDKMYSARNPRAGIGYSSISGFSKSKPVYLRPVKAAVSSVAKAASSG